jgi:hypothetical protein
MSGTAATSEGWSGLMSMRRVSTPVRVSISRPPMNRAEGIIFP